MTEVEVPGALDHVAGRRIVVTGGDGLIGGAVVRVLAEGGARVTVYDVGRSGAAESAAAAGAVAYVSGSVTAADDLAVVVAGQDAVVHLAGIAGLDCGTPEQIYAVNTLGTFLTMQAACRAGVAKLVYASSINANGIPLNPFPVMPTRYPWDESEPPVVADAYSLSKQANEAAAEALSRRHGVPMTGLRFPLVRDIAAGGGAVFARHIRRVLRRDPRRQACEGWTYLDVRDAAAAAAAALTHETPAGRGILVAAPCTYLRQPTEDALRRVAPQVPRDAVHGRDVPVGLHRAESLLGFKATVALEDLGPDLLADLDDLSDLDGEPAP